MKNDELTLRLLTSQSISLKLDEFVRLFFHRNALPFYLSPVAVWVGANARDLASLPRWVGMAVYLISIACFLVVMMASVWMLRRLIQKPRVLSIHLTPVVIVAMIAGVAAGQLTAVHMGIKPITSITQLVAYLVFYWLMTELVIGLSVVLFLPRALATLRAQRAASADRAQDAQDGDGSPPAPPVPETIRIGGRDIPLAELSHIEGDGNAVRVHFGSLSLRLSARFPNVITAVPPRAGMQIDRTVWVSASQAARAQLTKSGREATLRLADGTVLTVAQNRRTEVAAWLRTLERETDR